ncbi:MAG: ribonuclease III [Acidimicrobiia bacterium]|nr:MAG: ribonuclease III [Acidimicrobiia bacterium]
MTDTSDDPIAALEEAMGYRFESPAIRDEALTHPSFAAEHGMAPHYERLEFLGDAVLQLAVTRYVYAAMPGASEGAMTLVRAGVVAEPALAAVGRAWGVPDAVRLGRGETLTGGRDKESIVSDVVEALLGAISLEAGFAAAEQIVVQNWAVLIDGLTATPGRSDYKTRLQETLVAAGTDVSYVVTDTGPEHAKEFTATVVSAGEELATGHGSSKKRAEQDAAHLALKNLLGPKS